MKATVSALLVICLFPNLGFAAQVYGALRESGRPVGPNIKIEVMCGRSAKPYSALTDNYGSYRLFARETGKCTFRVYYQNQAPETIIDSYDDPVHYDFDLTRQPNGQYQLERK